ncbi:MAG TPA: nicotinate-nucleotide adenylyltransferase [Gemmataceae bacterium]|jgi:nicotinate-nucleotide adenylyltransferase
MRIGVFGGTFDPVHFGHLIMAEQCREQAALDQVWFVPSARPPHKLDRTLTHFAQRVEMLALALAGQPAFRVEEIEKDRPGPSYTADTLSDLSRLHLDHDWFLLLGSDTLSDLPTWHEPERVVAGATLLVVIRPGYAEPPADDLRRSLRLREQSGLRVHQVQSPLIDISSSDLRRRAAEGRSLRYFLPRSVECYIQAKGLYPAGRE